MSGKKRAIIELRDTPTVSENQQIVRVTAVCGGNQIEIETPSGEKCLCNIPTKFQKKVWIKRGDFIIADMLANAKPDSKVKSEVAFVLLPHHVKQLKRDGVWPPEFITKEDMKSREIELPPSDSESAESDAEEDSQEEDDEDDDDYEDDDDDDDDE